MRVLVLLLLCGGCAGPRLDMALAEGLTGVSSEGVSVTVREARFLNCDFYVAGICAWGTVGYYTPDSIVLGCSGQALAHELIHHKHHLAGTPDDASDRSGGHDRWTNAEWRSDAEYRRLAPDMCLGNREVMQ